MEPFFTIMIPVFNQMGKMDRCVESLKAQTFTDFEVLLIDDGSNDGSLEVLESFAKSDERFKVIKHDGNKSVLNARITAMSNAKGEHMMFIDIDDYIENNSFELIYNSLKENKVDVLTFGFIMEPQGKEVLPILPEKPITSYLRGEMPPCVWKSCYSRSVIEKTLNSVESFYCNMGEDGYITGIIYTYAESFGVLNKVLYHYITGDGMSSGSANLNIDKLKKTVGHVELSSNALIKFLSENNPEYVDDAKYAMFDNMHTLLWQYLLPEKDFRKIFEYISFFNNEEYAEVFDFACNVVLPAKIKMRLEMNEKNK
ncbi:MAG: glycosyltransferase [Lachnospiraceae bacterium]|nr:glycosyltransferase [Lachnospiraceae bacterium]